MDHQTRRRFGRHLRTRAQLTTVAVAFIAPAYAAPPDITPYASAGIEVDDNLFRFSGDEESVAQSGEPIDTETIYRVGGGVDILWPIRRQEFDFNLRINRFFYDKFDQLDYTGVTGNGVWRWVRGDLWNGRLGYSYVRSLSSFTERNSVTRDIKTANTLFGEAERLVTTRWRVYAGGSYRDVDFSDRERINREVAGGYTGARYVSRKGNSFGGEIAYRDTNFPNRPFDPVRRIDDGYTQTDAHAVLKWSVGGRSEFDVRVGYTRRDQDNISEDDFDGLTGRAAYQWKPTEKTTLSVAAWHDISALGDEIANYAEVTGAGVDVSYALTGKLFLDAGFSHEERDFQGVDPGISSPLREDDLTEYEIALRYQPRRNIAFKVGFDSADRSSNQADREFEYDRFRADARISF